MLLVPSAPEGPEKVERHLTTDGMSRSVWVRTGYTVSYLQPTYLHRGGSYSELSELLKDTPNSNRQFYDTEGDLETTFGRWKFGVGRLHP